MKICTNDEFPIGLLKKAKNFQYCDWASDVLHCIIEIFSLKLTVYQEGK